VPIEIWDCAKIWFNCNSGAGARRTRGIEAVLKLLFFSSMLWPFISLPTYELLAVKAFLPRQGSYRSRIGRRRIHRRKRRRPRRAVEETQKEIEMRTPRRPDRRNFSIEGFRAERAWLGAAHLSAPILRANCGCHDLFEASAEGDKNARIN
jgi:hypothetical protein